MKMLVKIILLLFSLISPTFPAAVGKIDAVMLIAGKDLRVFVKSITSALQRLVDVDQFYIITPDISILKTNLGDAIDNHLNRVHFVDETGFPFRHHNISEIMFETVRQKGIYPMHGNSQFEKTVWGRIGWFLQQLLKFYAGKVCGLNDFVLLDADLVWFRDVRFIAESQGNSSSIAISSLTPVALQSTNKYFYTSSSQYHMPYIATLGRISGVPYIENQSPHRSGIVHHMVIVKKVLDDMMMVSEKLHGGIPFWQVLLNISALEMTCRAPREGICGAGSTLSEYELYFNYARAKFPETVEIRKQPLLWANGPAPGLLFWPNIPELTSDGYKSNYLSHRQKDVMEAFEKQMKADLMQGYDFIGYHSYAKRRYFELVGEDLEILCGKVPTPRNSTCSWDGYEKVKDSSNRTPEDWFENCGCYMARNSRGP